MPKITDIFGIEQEINCIACSIQSGKINLPVERIAETKYFVLEQDFERPIEGFLIIASKRHIFSILDFTQEEYNDYNELVFKARKLLKETIGIKNITFIQEENSKDSHFHTWLFPWHNWMVDDFGSKLNYIKEIMTYAKQKHSNKKYIDKIIETSKLLKSHYNKI